MINKLMNNKILNDRPTDSVTTAAFIISVAGIASRVLGLLRDRILASHFGAGDTLDIYYAAFRIPDLIYNLLILGALSSAFIPVFTGLITHEKKDEAWKLASGMLKLAVIAIFSIACIFFIFANPVAKMIAPGFSPEKKDLTAVFTRIMFLSPLFLGVSAIFGGILVSFKKFLIYSIAPLMYNVGIIIGALFFVPVLGVSGLAWGVVLGAFLHMMMQIPAGIDSGYKNLCPGKEIFRNKNIQKVLKLMIPRTMGLAVSQINLLVITFFASLLASGSLSVFNFANNIQSVPLGVFGVSFAIAVFPHLSRSHAENLPEIFSKNFAKTFMRIIFFVLPISIFLIVLRAQFVRVFLGAGAFDWEDTIKTFNVMAIMSLSLFAQSLVPLLARTFYAMHDTKTPFYIAIVSEAANIIIVLSFLKTLGVLSLAIAFSVASFINMALLLRMLKKKASYVIERIKFKSVLKLVLASLIAAIVVQVLKISTERAVNIDTFGGIFFQLSVSSLAGIGAYFLACHFLKVKEFSHLRHSIMVKVFGQPADVVIDQDDSL
jgi:putative peptidoglycan lipid II flippase